MPRRRKKQEIETPRGWSETARNPSELYRNDCLTCAWNLRDLRNACMFGIFADVFPPIK